MPQSSDIAVPRGADVSMLRRHLNSAYEEFVSSGHPVSRMRQIVLDSWLRSVGSGIEPEHVLADIRLDDDELADAREAHPLSLSMPIIRRLLVESAAESGLLVAVSDASGQLLWVEGARALRTRAEQMHFVPGADWSESSAGTNAPGTSLALDRPVQIFGPEHLARQVTGWSCSAAPIHDPFTGAVLGVLDLTGGPEVATLQSLNLVRATVAAIEAELRVERIGRLRDPRPSAAPAGGVSLDVLGSHRGTLRIGDRTTRLTLRHSELLLLILEATDGMTTAELSVALSDTDQAQVTVRAELSRLRTCLDPVELLSRPYRPAHSIVTDVALVRAHLDQGETQRATDAYRGPVLPLSSAPGIERIREDLHLRLRSSLLASDDARALLSFAGTAHGRDDYDVWQRCLQLLDPASPRRSQVVGHLERLDAELR